MIGKALVQPYTLLILPQLMYTFLKTNYKLVKGRVWRKRHLHMSRLFADNQTKVNLKSSQHKHNNYNNNEHIS